MAAKNQTMAETAKRSIASPPAGVVWTFILGGLAAFLGWMAVSVVELREGQIRLEEGQKQLRAGQEDLQDGQEDLQDGQKRHEMVLDEIRSFLMRRLQ